MILISAGSTICPESSKIPPELVVIEMINQYRGDEGTLLVSKTVLDYLFQSHPEVFDFAASKNISIVQMPC